MRFTTQEIQTQRQKIRGFLRDGQATPQEIATELGLNVRVVQSRLYDLAREGVVMTAAHEPSGRSGRYGRRRGTWMLIN